MKTEMYRLLLLLTVGLLLVAGLYSLSMALSRQSFLAALEETSDD